MNVCPVCSHENPDDATQCESCRLSSDLFGAVREAAGDTTAPDPRYVETIGELLSAAHGASPAADSKEELSARISVAGRFPAAAAPAPRKAKEGPKPIEGFPPLPALSPGDPIQNLRRQLSDLLTLARRQGIETASFRDRAREAAASENRDLLESLTRDLFVHLTASLTEQYHSLLARRNDLSGLVSTASQDVELESTRTSISMGDLSGAQRRLRHIDETLTELEDEWATVQILLTEGELLVETLRELGGDATPALGPLTEGRRLAERGERERSEHLLARGALALWTILSPRFYKELNRLKEGALKQREEGAEIGPALQHLREVASYLRHRNFGAVVVSYRRLKEAVDGSVAAASPAEPDGGIPAAR